MKRGFRSAGWMSMLAVLGLVASRGPVTLAATALSPASAAAASVVGPECGAPVVVGTQATVTCSHTDAAQQWTVPAGVTRAQFDVQGSQGHGFPVAEADGGLGGRAVTALDVTPGEVLAVYVGGMYGVETGPTGEELPTGGFNGGGDPGSSCTFTSSGAVCGRSGFGGGGASDVRRTPYGLGERLVVAGGGGGLGGRGGPPEPGTGGGLVGGSAENAGTNGDGSGGNQDGTSGSGLFGVGSQGSTKIVPPDQYSGGGGGGGYYGGEGGYGTSGGGGSGFTPDGTGMTNGVRVGTGLVTITYTVKAPTTTALTSNVQTTVAGQPVTFTATVASASGTPTGTVRFAVDGGAPVAVTLSGGQAALTRTDLAVGAHSVTAQYLGSTLHLPSTSTSRAHTVNQASTTTVLGAAPSPSLSGQSVTFTATVAAAAPGAGTPTGTVTFRDGGTTLGTGTLNAARQASISTSSLSGGSHSITAQHNGDAGFTGSTSSSLTHTVNAAPAFAASTPPASATVGVAYSYTFTSTGSPASTFTLATGALPAGLTLSPGGVLSGTPNTPGAFTFTVQAANGVLPNAVTPSRTITVSPAPAAPAFTASTPPATARVGVAYSYTFTATGSPVPTFTKATGALPTGLTLSPAGVLSGTPTTAGAFSFTVQAANGVPPNAVTTTRTITVGSAATAPGVPSITSAMPGVREVTVAWEAPASNGGSAITGYTVTASPGGATSSVGGSARSTTLGGLTNGTSYTFTVVATNAVGTSASSPVSSAVVPGGFFALPTPARLMDTRNAPTVDGQFTNTGPLAAGSVTQLQTGGRAGIPANATAVTLNVTVFAPTASGYITVFPCGQPQPNASNLNYAPGDVIPNAVITSIGTAGKVCLFTSAPTHLIVDASGTLSPAAFAALPAPARLMDTRNAPTVDGQFTNTGPLAAGSVTQLQTGGRAGIPANATAVTLNVTVLAPTASGYITVFPCGQPQPNASNLNYAPGDVIPNAVITSIGTAGKVCLFTSAPTHLIVDASGTLSPAAFAALPAPARLMDTRNAPTVDGQFTNTGPLAAGSVTQLQTGGRAGIPANATAVTLNVTVFAPTAGGYITVFPCGQPQPNASNLNYAPGDVIPNAVITSIGTAGKVCLFTSAPTHLIVDASGTLG